MATRRPSQLPTIGSVQPTDVLIVEDGSGVVRQATVSQLPGTGGGGAAWHDGTGAPSAGLGVDGDYYLDTAKGDVHTKSAGAWSVTGNILGPAGPQGPQGEQGLQGPQGPAGADGATWWDSQSDPPSNAVGADGDFAISANGITYLKDGGSWIFWANIKGPTGPQGPQGEQGLQGPQGAAGADGATWRDGSGAPADTLGADGDYYLNNDTGDVFKRASGAYAQAANIRGPEGPEGAEGPQGPAGADGADGSRWHDGAGAPSAGLGADGDYYLDDGTGDVYAKAAGAWSPTGNIAGPQGPAGAGVPAGGTAGQVLAKNSNLDLDTIWVDQTGGGSGGFLSGSGSPSAGLGVDGNHYFNQDNGDFYRKESGSWVSLGAVWFDAGAAPAAGSDPIVRWYGGSGAPAAELGNDGDYYHDITTGDVYRKSSGAWSVVGSLIGGGGAVASVFGRTGAVAAQAGDYDGLPLDLQDQTLRRAEMVDYAETASTPAVAMNAVTVDYAAGNVAVVSLTADVTTLAITNPPAAGKVGTLTLWLVQDATGGRTVAWPGSVDWGDAAAPTPAGGANRETVVTLLTRDGGSSWKGMLGWKAA